MVEVNPKYFRLCEVGQLLNDSTKHRLLLGWNSTKASFHELVRIMVEHDMSFVKKDRMIPNSEVYGLLADRLGWK